MLLKGASVIETLYEQCQRSIQSPIPRGYKTPVLEDRKSHLSRKRSRIKKRDRQLRMHECTRRTTPELLPKQQLPGSGLKEVIRANEPFGYSTDIYGACIYRIYSRRYNPMRLDAV